MATVFVPPLMQKLTDDKPTIEVPGKSVREVINNLEEMYPGTKARLVDGFKIKPNISVAVNGEVTPIGMLEKVQENSEVHFLPAIGGGASQTVERVVRMIESLSESAQDRVVDHLREYIGEIQDEKKAESSFRQSVESGEQLVDYWQAEALIGTKPDILDSQLHARQIRSAAEPRVRP